VGEREAANFLDGFGNNPRREKARIRSPFAEPFMPLVVLVTAAADDDLMECG
jgi:hypothetical protein